MATHHLPFLFPICIDSMKSYGGSKTPPSQNCGVIFSTGDSPPTKNGLYSR